MGRNFEELEGAYRKVVGAVAIKECVDIVRCVLHVVSGWLIVKIAILLAAALDLEALAVGILQAKLVTCNRICIRILADEIVVEAVSRIVARGDNGSGWRGGAGYGHSVATEGDMLAGWNMATKYDINGHEV
jgi:hypothetical protein